MVSFLLFVFLLDEAGSLRQRFGKHSFPQLTTTFENEVIEPTNEFQIIIPQSITISINSDYNISSVTPLIISNDEIVSIKYNSSKAYYKDWIGAYSPIDVDITLTEPIKYGWCDESSTYLTKGYGELKFNLTNVRDDVIFYYFTGAPIFVTFFLA